MRRKIENLHSEDDCDHVYSLLSKTDPEKMLNAINIDGDGIKIQSGTC